jgi:SAM-dependent methyltransferase
MNENHARLCASPQWAAHIQDELLPPLTAEVSLGSRMLEIGPGPGAATEWLRHRVPRLTALEADPDAVGRLQAAYAGTNVEVLLGDAAAMDFGDASFDSVGTFTMLHHVPTVALQDRVLAEAFRVLRPGGVLIGSDSLPSTGLHEFHADDTYNPIDPASMLARLRTVGFGQMTVSVGDTLTFIARKPGPAGPDGAECGQECSGQRADGEQESAS